MPFSVIRHYYRAYRAVHLLNAMYSRRAGDRVLLGRDKRALAELRAWAKPALDDLAARRKAFRASTGDLILGRLPVADVAADARRSA
ncbi:MAG TPA: hypothetical protein VEA41_14250 [Salinarimonas sp.]|nr:hypothetical protein [Salinarimonas sp.]